MTSGAVIEGHVVAVDWPAILAVVGKSLTVRVAKQAESGKAPLDRAMRLVRHIDKISARLPEQDRPPRIDLARIAALYVSMPLPSDKKNELADDASELATDQLKNLLTEDDIEVVLQIIRDYQRRDAKLAEAKLLSDAVALEDVGLVGLWNGAYKYHGMGRSLEQFLKLWKTQREYGYWQTRLRDGFHFEISRSVAKERLARLEVVLAQMEAEHTAADIV
jgi:hypothetical protein